MTSDQVADALAGSLTELGIDASAIHPDVRLREDLELDSTEMVQVSLDLTRRLGVRIRLAPGANDTFQDACEAVAREASDP
ncbi:MAG TPA: phosphopantetheine-binding protein [Terriglobales bacterium]|nr:phosphopantetheine-binding protein [Terriglobales bacterium]